MQVYPGLPVLSPITAAPDAEQVPTTLALSRRVLENYAVRHAAKAEFRGLFQDWETDLHNGGFSAVLDLIGQQHAIARQVLPGKTIIGTAYLDARRRSNRGTTPDGIKPAVKALA